MSKSGPIMLRILTFNLYFEPICMDVRMKAIGMLIEKHRPAVIGFQERWARYYDCSSDIVRPFSTAYYVVLFSALPVLGIETLPFSNSGMGRELLFMHVEPSPGCSLFVGTSHLESLPQFARARVSQLQQSLTLLQERVHQEDEKDNVDCLGAIFMGDTNLLRADMKLLDPKLAAAVDLEVERAKTARSKCRKCGEAIQKNTVRVGKMGKDRLPNGRILEIHLWFHEACFLQTANKDEKEYVEKKSATECNGKEEVSTHLNSGDMDMSTAGLPTGWRDLWISVPGNTEENGYTFDGTTNGLVTSRAYQSRLDRMYFYAGKKRRQAFALSSATVLQKICIIGKEKITERLWPSDHYGLVGVFCFDESSSQTPDESTIDEAAGTKDTPINIE